MANKKMRGPAAPKIPDIELERALLEIGFTLKACRKAAFNLETFAYEIKVARSLVDKCEAGGDMRLSTFLKLLYGLNIQPEEFFSLIK
jgi:hypothetical protein